MHFITYVFGFEYVEPLLMAIKIIISRIMVIEKLFHLKNVFKNVNNKKTYRL